MADDELSYKLIGPYLDDTYGIKLYKFVSPYEQESDVSFTYTPFKYCSTNFHNLLFPPLSKHNIDPDKLRQKGIKLLTDFCSEVEYKSDRYYMEIIVSYTLDKIIISYCDKIHIRNLQPYYREDDYLFYLPPSELGIDHTSIVEHDIKSRQYNYKEIDKEIERITAVHNEWEKKFKDWASRKLGTEVC